MNKDQVEFLRVAVKFYRKNIFKIPKNTKPDPTKHTLSWEHWKCFVCYGQVPQGVSLYGSSNNYDTELEKIKNLKSILYCIMFPDFMCETCRIENLKEIRIKLSKINEIMFETTLI